MEFLKAFDFIENKSGNKNQLTLDDGDQMDII